MLEDLSPILTRLRIAFLQYRVREKTPAPLPHTVFRRQISKVTRFQPGAKGRSPTFCKQRVVRASC